MRIRRTWEVIDGINVAMSTKRLPRKWFDALTDNPEQADELEFQTNAGRMERAIMNRLGKA